MSSSFNFPRTIRFVGKGVTTRNSKEISVDRDPLVRLPSSANTVNSIILLPHLVSVCRESRYSLGIPVELSSIERALAGIGLPLN
jgi:hypothetical protein